MTDTWEDNLWTDATRAAYLEAGEAAIESFRAHLALVAAASNDTAEETIDESAETVRLAFLAASDAEFNYSGTLAPFSLLEADDEIEDVDVEVELDADEDAALDAAAEHNQVSIMFRRDYRLTSEAAFAAAASSAYLELEHDEDRQAAVDDVDGLARSIFQVIQAGGVDALSDVPGLEPVAGVVLAVARDELMTESDVDDVLDNAGELFSGEVDVIFSQAEVWG